MFSKPPQTQFLENSEVIFCNSSFSFRSAQDAENAFAEENSASYIYSRFSNPSVTAFCQRIAELEQGEKALATASGMSAILSLVFGLCQSGDTVVCGGGLFGATVQLLNKHFAKYQVHTHFVFDKSIEAWCQQIDQLQNVKLVFLESPSNPMQSVIDIKALSVELKKRGIILAVDNCFCPYLQKPLLLGADIVVGSGTKYIDGQGRLLSGYLVGSADLLEQKIFPFLRSGGPALSAFNAWIMYNGLETLPLRIAKHSQSALQIAEWLEQQPAVQQVYYTALPSHPDHRLAMQQQSGMGGGVISFVLNGGKKSAFCFIDALTRFSITANFGDAMSAVTHPASTTHVRVPADIKQTIGLTDGLVRLAIGLEPVELLQNDIEQALKKAVDG